MKFWMLGFCMIVVSCKTSHVDEHVNLFKGITAVLPRGYIYEKATAVDSELGYIVSPSKVKIACVKGFFPLQVVEPPIVVLPDSLKDFHQKPIFNLIYSDSAEFDERYGLNYKNYYKYDIVDGLKALIISPKTIGHGTTAVLVNRLPDSSLFVIYGEDLDSTHHKSLLNIASTIKISKPR